MISVLHQIFFMTYVSGGQGTEELDIDLYRTVNFEFSGENHVLEEGLVVFDFSEVQE